MNNWAISKLERLAEGIAAGRVTDLDAALLCRWMGAVCENSHYASEHLRAQTEATGRAYEESVARARPVAEEAFAKVSEQARRWMGFA